MNSNISILLWFLLIICCKESEKADLIILNANVYTADTVKIEAQAFAIKGNIFLAVGSNQEIRKFQTKDSKVLDLNGAFVMPGLIEGHGHFLSLGKSLHTLNLIQTKSWQEIVDSVKAVAQRTPKGQWIEGRGWHQEKWSDRFLSSFNAYPYHDALSAVTPDHPVMLTHASGHALMANSNAMNLASISSESVSPKGGRIVKDHNNRITGIFEENAMSLIQNLYDGYEKKMNPDLVDKLKLQYALSAQEIALSYGITSFQDAGTSLTDLELIKDWFNDGKLSIRLYAMLYEDKDSMLNKMLALPIYSKDSSMFKCIAIKSYIDGALGSYGAWLLEDYSDNPGMRGQNLIEIEQITSFALLATKMNLQVCVHAIGDRANREVLNIFSKFEEQKRIIHSRPWRIEHCQHLHPGDILKIKDLGIIASMQAIHCTSDAPFVIKRLGEKRAREGAYVWRSLIDRGVHLANGTDCPVESINPFDCIYAAVTRKRVDNGLQFFPEQSMSRDEALKSYTIWNAYASGDENIKGSITKGKLADFIVLDRNLLTCSDSLLLAAKVQNVFIGGKKIK
ncbi:MAG: amidohydrolase [Saprospiraceae bacterium]|nr:amidohydrolase [Saprospiraceae bacterium]